MDILPVIVPPNGQLWCYHEGSLKILYMGEWVSEALKDGRSITIFYNICDDIVPLWVRTPVGHPIFSEVILGGCEE